MKKIGSAEILLLLASSFLLACGPTEEQIAAQTAGAQTAIAASWTETPIPTSTATPTPTTTLTPSPIPPGSGNGQIAFAHSDGETGGIYLINPDGSGLAQIVGGEGLYGSAAWSPGGTRLTYEFYHDEQLDLYLIGAGGSGNRPLSSFSESDHTAIWSPDGTRVAFVSGTGLGDSTPSLYVVEVDGGEPVLLVEGISGAYGEPYAPFDWSLDGDLIALTVVEDRVSYAYTVRADGTGSTRIAVGHSPRFLPDGRIVFSTPWEDDALGLAPGIYSAAPDGSDIQQLAAVAAANNVAISPDGGRIAFTSDPALSLFVPVGHVFVMNVAGGDLQNLTLSLTDPLSSIPIWSPDSERILISAYNVRKRQREFYVANADGSGVILLADLDEEGQYGGVWSPDGTWIVFEHLSYDGNYYLYIVRPDGTELTRLPTPAGWIYGAAWRP